jgi:hypothetical protein
VTLKAVAAIACARSDAAKAAIADVLEGRCEPERRRVDDPANDLIATLEAEGLPLMVARVLRRRS